MGWTRVGEIPDFSIQPRGGLRATTVFYKVLVAHARGTTRPDSYATTTACARSRSPSFRRTWLTWVLTVSSLSTSRSAISRFERPSATRPRISVSRGVSAASPSGRLLSGPEAGELGDQPARDRGREQRVPGGDDAHCLEKRLGRDVLEQESAGARVQRVVDVLVEVERREDEDARAVARRRRADLPGGLDAVHHGHADVHQHDVGRVLARSAGPPRRRQPRSRRR